VAQFFKRFVLYFYYYLAPAKLFAYTMEEEIPHADILREKRRQQEETKQNEEEEKRKQNAEQLKLILLSCLLVLQVFRIFG
jgi:hypothetical protein